MIVNYLSSETVNQSASTSGWVVSSGSATLANSASKQLYSGLNSLLVTAGNNSPITLSTEQVNIPAADNEGAKRGFVWVYSAQELNLSATIYTSYGGSSASAAVGFLVRPLKWTLLSVLETADPIEGTVGTARLEILVNAGGLEANDLFYLAHPAICIPLNVADNELTSEIWLRCPEYIRDADYEQTDPDFPLIRFIDVLTVEANKLFSYWEDFRYDTPDDFLIEKKSSLVTPSLINEKWLNWLAQFVGTKLSDPSAGSSSWLSLLSAADTNNDGTTTWEEIEAEVDTADVGTDVSWEEIEAFAPELTNLDEILRWQVSSAAYGFNGGTGTAIKEAAKQGLTDTKTVTLTSRYGGDPWTIGVGVLAAEVDSVGTIADLVASATPAGFEIVVTSS